MIMPKMGTKRLSRSHGKPVAGHSSVADALFTGTQQRVLALLFGQPNRSFYATELIGLANSGSGAVQRELAKLSQSGLVTVKTVGSQKHYQANANSPIYAELHGITQKTVGLAEPLPKDDSSGGGGGSGGGGDSGGDSPSTKPKPVPAVSA